MPKTTNEDKLKYIGLNLNKIPQSLKNFEKVDFKPLRGYEDNNYKAYKYINAKDIEILITPEDRLVDLNEKFKKALPIAFYLDSENEETHQQHATFLNLLNDLDIEKLKELEEEQNYLNENIPYEVKYRNNYRWQIYYSESDDKYFMLFSSNENNSEALFYIIKQKLSKKSEKIYVPISHLDYSGRILKKSEITDLENYLWLFTKEWPNIYEVHDKKDKLTLEIIGKTKVYEDIKSIYKITLKNEKEAQETFKLIKALFILQSTEEIGYDFKAIVNEKGGIDFCYNFKKITYSTLPEFIRQEFEIKNELIENLYNDTIVAMEKLDLLKNTVDRQKEEFLMKEKQIANFLECKKTFFGRVRFFFKKGKKAKDDQELELKKAISKKEKLKERIETIGRIDSNENIGNKISELKELKGKEQYTIEDLLKVCEVLKEESTKLKNMQMDISALELKSESLTRKIQNATMYINEIESHKKSIFDFWKFTNKDENNLLNEAKEEENENSNKLKKVFEFEQDIEDYGKKIDIRQKEIFSKEECDAIFAIRNDITTFNLLNKEKVLKKDDALIEKQIKELKKEYEKEYKQLQEKDYDIFGNVAQDKTKIKTLKNNKHREIEKDKYKVLNIKPETTLKEYKENIINYKDLLNQAYGKMVTSYDLSLYKVEENELNENSYEIFDLSLKAEIEKEINEEKINIYRLNIKENMPVIFYSNIMFFDNINQTLPDGMDVETKALIDLSKYNLKLVSRKDFNMNVVNDELKNNIKLFQVYEYELETKARKV